MIASALLIRVTNASAAALLLLACAAIGAWAQDDLRQRYGLTPLPPIPYPVDNQYNPDRVELEIGRAHV